MEKNKSLLLIITIILFSVISISSVFGTQSKENPEIYLVALNHEKGNEEFSIQSNQISISEIQKNFLNDFSEEDFKVIYEYSNFPVIAIEATEENLRLVEKNPIVSSISPDREVYLMMNNVTEIIKSKDYIDHTGYNGTGQTVCVIDTGVDYTHTYLGDGWGNIVIAGANTLQEVIVCNESNPSPCMDGHSHGTHVAGIIASQNETYKGVAPGAKIIAIKAMDDEGSGSSNSIIKGIDWCLNNSEEFNISIISMSLGMKNLYWNNIIDCENDNSGIATAVNAATDAGIVVVAASGNDGQFNQITAPACIENVISVGSTNKSDFISSFSNRGNLLDFLAPGQSIISTILTNNFGSKSGTSMATPAVSGAIALLNEYNQNVNSENLNVSQVREILNKTKDRISDENYEYPRINLMDSLEHIYCNCNCCESCTHKINDEICSVVYIEEDIYHNDSCIILEAQNKTIDCQGHSITGNKTDNGIFLNNSNNSIIKNCVISNYTISIVLNNSSESLIENTTTLNNSKWDFYMANSSLAQTENLTIGNLTKNITISFEAKDIGLIYSEPIEIKDGFSHINHFLNITNTSESSWMSLNISYDEDDLSNLKEYQKENLMIWKFNGTWNPIFESGINEDHIYSGNISIFSVFTTKVDTKNPNIELEANTTEIEFAEEYIKINWTATDNYELDSVLFEAFYPNQTTIINSKNATGEIIFEPEILKLLGNYTIKLWANDTIGNENTTNKTFEVIDSTLPEIKFVSPTTEAGTHNQKYIAVNATTDNTDDLNKTTIYLYDEENMMYIQSTNETELYHNFTNLPDGIYFLNATVNNTKYGNVRTTETRKIILDTTPPVLEIISPKGVTYSNRNILIEIFAEDEHSDIDRIWYMIEEDDEDDEKNITYIEPHTISFSQGSHILHVWANDSVGHISHKKISFVVRISSWSGGGSAPREPEPESELIEWTEDEKIESRMKIHDTLTFSIDNKEHTLRIRSMYSDRVSIRIRSRTIDLNLDIGETKEVDILRNGINDISIHLEKISHGYAYLSIERLRVEEIEKIDEEVDEIDEPEEIPEETHKTEPTKTISEPKEEEINYIFIGGFVFAMIILGILAYLEIKKGD